MDANLDRVPFACVISFSPQKDLIVDERAEIRENFYFYYFVIHWLEHLLV